MYPENTKLTCAEPVSSNSTVLDHITTGRCALHNDSFCQSIFNINDILNVVHYKILGQLQYFFFYKLEGCFVCCTAFFSSVCRKMAVKDSENNLLIYFYVCSKTVPLPRRILMRVPLSESQTSKAHRVCLDSCNKPLSYNFPCCTPTLSHHVAVNNSPISTSTTVENPYALVSPLQLFKFSVKSPEIMWPVTEVADTFPIVYRTPEDLVKITSANDYCLTMHNFVDKSLSQDEITIATLF